MCDSLHRLNFLSLVKPGTTHEITASDMSSVGRLISIETNQLLSGYWTEYDDSSDAYIC